MSAKKAARGSHLCSSVLYEHNTHIFSFGPEQAAKTPEEDVCFMTQTDRHHVDLSVMYFDARPRRGLMTTNISNKQFLVSCIYNLYSFMRLNSRGGTIATNPVDVDLFGKYVC